MTAAGDIATGDKAAGDEVTGDEVACDKPVGNKVARRWQFHEDLDMKNAVFSKMTNNSNAD